MWKLIIFDGMDMDKSGRFIHDSSTLRIGTLRQCMDKAASIVPKYHGWGLTLDSICNAWGEIFHQDADGVWLDRKREYFYLSRVK